MLTSEQIVETIQAFIFSYELSHNATFKCNMYNSHWEIWLANKRWKNYISLCKVYHYKNGIYRFTHHDEDGGFLYDSDFTTMEQLTVFLEGLNRKILDMTDGGNVI